MQYFNINYPVAFITQSLLFILTTMLGWGIWRKQCRKLAHLQRQQELAENTLRKFMEESEKTFLEVCRWMTSRPKHDEKTREESELANGWDSRTDRDSGETTKYPGSRKSFSIRESDKRIQVVNLAEKGIAVSDIGNRLNIPRGEIELILNLEKKNVSCRDSIN
jgi:hypothetical protein